MEPLQEQLTLHMTQKSILENDISVLPALEELREEEARIRAEIETLENERRKALTDSRIQSFGDGYEHGKVSRDVMSEEEYDSWRDSHLTVSNLALRAKSNASADRAVQRAKSTGMRPHQAIRKAITDRFDENNS